MRHLYLQIYTAFVGILLVFLFMMSATWWMLRDQDDRLPLAGVATLVAEAVPPRSAPPADLDAAVEKLANMFSARVTLRDRDGTLLAHAGEVLPPPPPDQRTSGVRHIDGLHSVAILRLPDGRWILARRNRDPHRYGWLISIGLLALTMAVGAYPVVRRITRRLEQLRASVDALGAGTLDARVRVEGKDEVADLANSLNRAAGRIEHLVNAQRQLLANASHELRSPLTRMRMALELLEKEDRPDLRTSLAKDITELDELVGEILLASRLEKIEELERKEVVDMLALLAEECARSGATVSGEPVSIEGDPRLLRRMLRNLLENAQRHSGGSTVEAYAGPGTDGMTVLRVEDRGPGIPEDDRERIFEPFYRTRGSRETGEGVGLGLSLVRQIAQRHQGSVRCLSRPGGGTSFEVTLPGLHDASARGHA